MINYANIGRQIDARKAEKDRQLTAQIEINRKRLGLRPLNKSTHYSKCEKCDGTGCGFGDNGACTECNGFGEVRELP